MQDTACVFIGGMQVGVNCLKQLLKKEIVPKLVIGNLDDDGKDKDWYPSLVKFSLSKGLPTLIKKSLHDPQIVKKIRDAQPEIIFTVGGNHILPKEVLDIPHLGCINIHPSLLPKYGGRCPAAHAIFHGEKYAGTTLHWVTAHIDAGPIIFQERIKIHEDDTAQTLYKKLFIVLAEKLFKKFLDFWLSGKTIPSRAQNRKHATYFSKTDFPPNDGVIDWSWSNKKIRNFIRAMIFASMDPPIIKIGKKELVIIDKRKVRECR